MNTPVLAPTSPLDWATAKMLFAMGVPLQARWAPNRGNNPQWSTVSTDSRFFAPMQHHPYDVIEVDRCP